MKSAGFFSGTVGYNTLSQKNMGHPSFFAGKGWPTETEQMYDILPAPEIQQQPDGNFRRYMDDRQKARRSKPQKVSRAKLSPLHKTLLSAFSPTNYGVTDPTHERGRRFAYKATTVVHYQNIGSRLKRLCGADLENHWRNLDTLYYQGNEKITQERILLMLDPDAKNGEKGTLEAIKYISDKYFDGKVHVEPSTSGKGHHGYVWLYKLGRGAAEVNAGIDRLQDIIRADLAAMGFDISGFDIQGTCPVIKWRLDNGRWNMSQFVNGRLAKIPRTATSLLQAAEITLDSISLLSMPSPKPSIPSPTLSMPDPARNFQQRQACYGGTLGAEDFTEADRQHYMKTYRRLVGKYNQGADLQANRRYRVGEEHAAICFAILKFCHENPNKDGTLSQARAEQLWTTAYDNGLVTRTWNHHRWTAFRDFLSVKCGYIDWRDATYFHYGDERRVGKRGKACKFAITEELVSVLDMQGGDLGIQPLPQGTGQRKKPKEIIPPDASGRRKFNELLRRAMKEEENLYAA